MRYAILISGILLLAVHTQAQKHDRQWVFPVSAGIDWNDSLNPVTYNGAPQVNQAMTTASIADSAGNLLFYAQGFAFATAGGRVYNRLHQTMLNGDSILGDPWCNNAFIILPAPNQSNKFYLITTTRSSSSGYSFIYYSIIDMTGDGGLGEVISRDNTTINEEMNEKISACKHANGRDWWIITSATVNDHFNIFLLDPTGFNLHHQQTIGPPTAKYYIGSSAFTRDGLKFIALGLQSSSINIFDFDRCTGQLSNYRQAGENSFSQANAYFGLAISPQGKYLYTTAIYAPHKKAYQFDITAIDPLSTKQLINFYPDTGISSSVNYLTHCLGPDGRIYFGKGNPYIPNANTPFTQSLDAVLYPDSPGVACAYTSGYLNLGGNFSSGGLPNMPNYQLGPVVGSLCDTIFTAVGHQKLEKYITVYPNPSGGVFNFELRQAGDAIRQIKIYNSQGKLLPEQPQCGGTCSTIDMGKQPTGLYYYRCTTTTGKTYTGKLLCY
jgi:hypothetical protein